VKDVKMKSQHAEKISVAKLSVYTNALLIALKVGAGLLTGSLSVISEAVHSGVDLLAAFIANVSVKKSSMPADKEHAFGHGKFENISGVIEALLIIVVALVIIYESGLKLISRSFFVEYAPIGIAVMGISMVVNTIVSKRLMVVAKRTESLALEADAWHLYTDVYTSAGVFIGLIVIYFTGLMALDPIIAIIIAIIIMKAGYDITKKSVVGLIDVKLPDEELNMIESIIKEHYAQYVDAHNIRTRKSGSERFIDMHLVFPKDVHIEEAHDLCDHLEKDIKEKISNANILIHMESCSNECSICPERETCQHENILIEKVENESCRQREKKKP
jgi:cation diffusion facilitator family transporter